MNTKGFQGETPVLLLLQQKNRMGLTCSASEALNSGKAFGLHNIIERSRVIGGKAQLHSSPQGTIVVITIPYSTAT